MCTGNVRTEKVRLAQSRSQRFYILRGLRFRSREPCLLQLPVRSQLLPTLHSTPASGIPLQVEAAYLENMLSAYLNLLTGGALAASNTPLLLPKNQHKYPSLPLSTCRT